MLPPLHGLPLSQERRSSFAQTPPGGRMRMLRRWFPVVVAVMLKPMLVLLLPMSNVIRPGWGFCTLLTPKKLTLPLPSNSIV